jgi:hypothetical protein
VWVASSSETQVESVYADDAVAASLVIGAQIYEEVVAQDRAICILDSLVFILDLASTQDLVIIMEATVSASLESINFQDRVTTFANITNFGGTINGSIDAVPAAPSGGKVHCHA